VNAEIKGSRDAETLADVETQKE
jgi:hypothetical protein